MCLKKRTAKSEAGDPRKGRDMGEPENEPLNRKLAEKIANQLDIAGYDDAADYVRSDFIAVQINLVLREQITHKERAPFTFREES